jgi:hypothetical protein
VTTGAFWSGAFSPTVFYCDTSASTSVDRTDGRLPEDPYRNRRKSRREQERPLDLAIQKATGAQAAQGRQAGSVAGRPDPGACRSTRSRVQSGARRALK